jgi:phage tail tape-measure protein
MFSATSARSPIPADSTPQPTAKNPPSTPAASAPEFSPNAGDDVAQLAACSGAAPNLLARDVTESLSQRGVPMAKEKNEEKGTEAVATVGGAAGGAAAGAAAGSLLGPIGAAVGALVGGVGGAVLGKGAAKGSKGKTVPALKEALTGTKKAAENVVASKPVKKAPKAVATAAKKGKTAVKKAVKAKTGKK